MSTTRDLILALKAELKAAGVTYAQLAVQLGLAESSVKRIFAKADMPLSRIDDVLRVLKLDFVELARTVADTQPTQRLLSLAQEKALVADRKLLAIATCCASQWTFAQMVSTYAISEMAFFRNEIVGDFYAGRFDGDGETLFLVHGQVSVAQAWRLRRATATPGG